MLITRTSQLTWETHTREIPITEAAYQAWKESGWLIQHAFPNLTPDQREFLLTGATPEEWEEAFGDDEE